MSRELNKQTENQKTTLSNKGNTVNNYYNNFKKIKFLIVHIEYLGENVIDDLQTYDKNSKTI